MEAVKIGKHFVCLSPVKGVVQLVAPAENTDGVVIATSCIAVGTGTVNLVAGTSAPTGTADLSKAIIFSSNGNTSAAPSAEVFMPYPLFVPAGQGLWAVGQSTGSSAISVTWDLIN